MDMESWKLLRSVCIFSFLLGSCFVYQSLRVVDAQEDPKPAVTLQVDASNGAGRPIPETLFGIFFEEINHAGAGGLWAELVSNRVSISDLFVGYAFQNVSLLPHFNRNQSLFGFTFFPYMLGKKAVITL